MVVSAGSHPALHGAITLLYHDMGKVNRMEPPLPEEYIVPPGVEPMVDAAERALAALDEDELGTFVYGENGAALAISQRTPDLTDAHTLLNRFFEEG